MRIIVALGVMLIAPQLATPALAQADHSQTEALARGEYLTRAADCTACHTAPGGVDFAGGREFVLPFGKLYSPNITPDAATGIGGYTDNEWVAMLREGVARGGRHLYPAMPYTSYTQMTREDALLVKTYLMSLAPVHQPPRENRIRFPFNQRWGMIAWNWINNPDQRFAPDATRSAAYNRGAYLVNALGHCQQCHTPRNFMMGLKTSKAFAGAQQDGWLAYNLTSDGKTGLGGWTDSQLAQYLSTGHTAGRGPAAGPMAQAVENSLRYLTPSDIGAMITYLRAIPGQVDGPAAVVADTPAVTLDPLGARIFGEACAGCHLPNGEGRQSRWAGLLGDHDAGDPTGLNIVQVLVEGSHLETGEGRMFMHAFTGAYTDGELAALGNYTIGQFGHRQGTITPQQIQQHRRAVPGEAAKSAS
jgi:mono/diheme cytochrome c family protein